MVKVAVLFALALGSVWVRFGFGLGSVWVQFGFGLPFGFGLGSDHAYMLRKSEQSLPATTKGYPENAKKIAAIRTKNDTDGIRTR